MKALLTQSTVVKLLFAIGVLALIVSIKLPELNKIRQERATQAAIRNLSQIGLGILLYTNDNHGKSQIRWPH